MAKVRKQLIRPGVYSAPQGRLHATPDRIKGWRDRFRAMKAAGIRIPMSWGHAPDALPIEDKYLQGADPDKAEKTVRQWWLSRYNAGYLEDLDIDPQTGALEFSADVPGCEVDEKGNLIADVELPGGQKVKAAVGEVSAAIKPWTDGQGRRWDDAVIHVAITPLPVVDSQPGFVQLSAAPADGIYLSNATLLFELSGGNMAEEKEKEEGKAEEKPPEAKAEEKPPEAEKPPETPPPAPADEGDAKFHELLSLLRARGISVPEDTTPKNFIEHLCTAVHAIEHAEQHQEAEDAEDEDEDAEAGDEGEGYGGPDDGGGNAVEEQRPLLMSLTTAELSPLERKLLEGQQAKRRKNLLARIDKLQKLGMPKERADKFREAVSGYELSLDPDTLDPVDQELDRELSAVEDTLGWAVKQGVRKQVLGHVRRSIAEPRPDLRSEGLPPDEIAALAAKVSRSGK